MKVMRSFFVAFIMFLLMFSCKNPNEKILMNSINSKWNKNDIQKFDFEINDNQNQKNIIFIVRNNNDYPYSNLRLIAKIDYNNKTITTDTLNYILAEPSGKWLGSGFGDTKEALFQYKMNYKFPQNGRYSVKVEQAMRKNILQGIEDLGINVQNIKP